MIFRLDELEAPYLIIDTKCLVMQDNVTIKNVCRLTFQ